MLTPQQIEQLWCEYPSCEIGFARAVEAEARKQDDALILQLVEALESARVWKCKEIHHMMREAQYTPAIQAARARLENT